MSRIAWFGLVVALAAWAGSALAAPPPAKAIDTIEARLRALEKRVSDLEDTNADLERRLATAPAAPATPQRTTAPAAPLAEAGVRSESPRAQSPANWAALRIGMTWSEVKTLLGRPDKVRTGVFGDVMYFANGGSVEFDRNTRVSKWSETPDE